VPSGSNHTNVQLGKNLCKMNRLICSSRGMGIDMFIDVNTLGLEPYVIGVALYEVRMVWMVH